MNYNIQILLTITAAATGSFLQTPSNQLESTFNSTFLTVGERLFKPIIIPNVTHNPITQKTTANEKILKSIFHPQDSSQESTIADEEPKATRNSLRFSSRYSTKNDVSKESAIEDEKNVAATEFPTGESSKNEEIPKLISNRSDNFDSEENKKDSEESEESEAETTEESPKSISYGKYQDRESDNEETFTTEETESSEEKEDEVEDKRSAEDYYNSGSKNYHSIQTPLDRIKYHGPHSFIDDRKRIVAPIVRHPVAHNWPYSKSQLKKELENLNEISESEESYEKELDKGISEEVRTPKQLGLELAEEKDRRKFDQGKKYNYIELRNQRKQQQKALIAQEEKDDQKPLFHSLRQYQVDEEEPSRNSKRKPIINFQTWSTKKPPITTTQDYSRFEAYSSRNPTFQAHQFLGPVVFNQNLDPQTHKPKTQKDNTRNIFLKGLIDNEKLDQEKLTNQRQQKSVFRTGSKEIQSFNHLKESDDMYNAILANIQSVFGVRTQPLKSGTRSQKGFPEVSLDESKALTWSVPLIKATESGKQKV